MHIFATSDDPETVYIQPNVKRVSIKEQLYILEDKEKEWTIEDVRSEPIANYFQKNKEDIPNFGYTSSAYWVYFSVNNKTETAEFLFEIGYPSLHDIEIYIYDGTGLREKVFMGSKYPFHERSFFHPNFLRIFNMEPNETLTFYIRFESRTSLQMPLYIYEHSGFIQAKQFDLLIYGITYGILGVMALYNLFIYFTLRHTSYLYYVFVILATFFSNLSFTGVAYQYLWPNSPNWNELSVVFFLVLGMIFAVLFAYTFLEIKEYLPRFKVLFHIAFILNVLLLFFVLFDLDIVLNLMSVIIFAMFALILLSALLSWKRGLRQARFFILAWTVFLCGVFLTVLADGAIIPINTFTKFSGQISAMIEVVLLSFALADRINILQREKNDAVKQLYESQKLANENLRRTDVLKDEFLAMTSHELRTPLNGIIGIAETLYDGAAGELPEDVRKHLSIVVMSGRRLSHMINDILDFSNLKNDKLNIRLAPVHLYELTNVVLVICHSLVKDKPIQLINKISPTTPLVFADENRLQQILYNLVGNAIKYTEQGEVIVTSKQTGDYLTIEVSDTGRGIPPNQLDAIFDYFYQLDQDKIREVGGSGIGLSITKHLVELHKGTIKVKSKPGYGSTFSFTLPISQDQADFGNEAAATFVPFIKEIEDTTMMNRPASTTLNKSAKILIADDEPVNLQVLMNQLTLADYDVITASNGEEVIEMVERQSIDLLILDIMMPKMSGYEVCQQLRQEYTLTDLPILMLTAKNQVHDKVIAFEVGANDYLAKPCDRQELLSRVNTLIQLSQLNQKLKKMNSLLEGKVKERTQELYTANRTLEKANNDLKEMAQSRSRLLANVSHELGTPVTVIQSYVQAVKEGLIPANELYYLEMVSNKVVLLDRLIEDLSDLSRLEAGQINLEIKEVHLDQWITDIYSKFEFEILQGDRQFTSGTIDVNLFKPFICAIDIDRMDQVLSNLIWNAIRHTSASKGEISLLADVVEDGVIIQVKDNGEGISEDALPLIFDRFYKDVTSLKTKSTSGTGLGLAIVKEIILAHNGKVRVESKLNVGSTFYITIPICKKDNRR